MRALCAGVMALAAAGGVLGDVREDFARANSVFEASVSLLGKNETSAAEGLRTSAELYEGLAREHGIESSDLYTNAGNARLLAGETGRAIALYHRALRVDPGDANARANLEVARTRARVDVSIETSPGALELLTSWRRAVPAETRALVVLGAWGGLWVWGAARLLGARAGRWTSVALPLGVAGAVAGATVVADAATARVPVGVVIAGETVGRTGPDAAVYDPSFTKALPEGVEFVVVDRRAGWVLGRLGDGRETWVEARDVELVGV